jgi:hypothetical protein
MASVTVAPVMAANYTCLNGTAVSNMNQCNEFKNSNYVNKDLGSTTTTIINVIIGIVGFLAVIMIIIGGISYTTSAGDAGKVKKAKDTIMYGIIGLIVAILAFAIVNFVLTNLG